MRGSRVGKIRNETGKKKKNRLNASDRRGGKVKSYAAAADPAPDRLSSPLQYYYHYYAAPAVIAVFNVVCRRPVD
jgi:hypothetical protein